VAGSGKVVQRRAAVTTSSQGAEVTIPRGFLGYLLAGVSALEIACIETPPLPRRLPLGQQYTTRDLIDDKSCLIPKGTEIMVQGGSFEGTRKMPGA
jgi:hypothetical protein